MAALDTSPSFPLSVPQLPAKPRPRSAGATRVGAINALLRRAWDRGWWNEASLHLPDLVASATARTGLTDFGPEARWRPSLQLLCDALTNEARLSPLGKVLAHGQLVATLANRARAHELWRRHPEIADIEIVAPIVVLGQMRSGSTRVQRLLACDEGFAHTRFYESWNPLPIVTAGPLFDDRRWRGAAALGVTRLLNPLFDAIHPTSATAPDEEIGLHCFSFFGTAFEAQWRVPSFVAHGEAMDARPVYAEFKHLLQTLAWFRGGEGRPWILKVPQFAQDLPAVLATFPDARLLCLDRDTETLVASSASLVRNQMALQSDAVDPHWIGREWARKTELRRARLATARHAASGVPQLDLDYATMDADWEGEMRRVYRFLGRALDERTLARMQAMMARSGRRRARAHRYSLAEFGLTVADLEREFPLAA